MDPPPGAGAGHRAAVFSGIDEACASRERALLSAGVRVHVLLKVSSRRDKVSFGRCLARAAQAEPSGCRLRNVRTTP
jgi:hypothetical protein